MSNSIDKSKVHVVLPITLLELETIYPHLLNAPYNSVSSLIPRIQAIYQQRLAELQEPKLEDADMSKTSFANEEVANS